MMFWLIVALFLVAIGISMVLFLAPAERSHLETPTTTSLTTSTTTPPTTLLSAAVLIPPVEYGRTPTTAASRGTPRTTARAHATSTTVAVHSDRPPDRATGDPWPSLGACESGALDRRTGQILRPANPAANTGNGFYGAFQFTLNTWHSLGYDGYPYSYPYSTQLAAAVKLQARSGWGQWPDCSRALRALHLI